MSNLVIHPDGHVGKPPRIVVIDDVQHFWKHLTDEQREAAGYTPYEAPPRPEPSAEAQAEKRRSEILSRLGEIDSESVRPLRAVTAGTATQADRDRLTVLEVEAQSLRTELASPQPSE